MRFTSKPCVSVIMPTFNRSRFIRTAIKSLLSQTFTDWELLIVDDGSTDSTMQIVEPYLFENPRVRYMKHSNRKAPLSRNAGMQASFGKFITFPDSDDYYLPNHLASRVSIIGEPDSPDLLVGGILAPPGTMVRDRTNPEMLVPLEQCIPGATFFGRRELFFALSGFRNLPYAEDTDLWERATAAGWKLKTVDHPKTYIYQQSPDSITQNYRQS